MSYHWRPYQVDCKKAIKEKFKAGITEQLIVQATGTGKRIQAVDLARHFPRTLFIAHREELIMQAYDDIDRMWPMQVGIIKGKVFEAHKRVVIASVQTLYNRLDKIPVDSFELLIIDEAHHYVSPTYLECIRHFQPKLRTSWTATPKRLDGISLTNIAEEIVYQYKIEDGIRDGWLSELEAYQIKTQTDLSKIKKVAGDFNQGQLSEAVDSELRNNLIASKYKEYAKDVQALAYCVDIDHAYNLARVLRDNGINADTVVSDDSRCTDRTGIVERFKHGKIDVLTNVNILTEGFDYSDVGCILMARPTQSETLYIQCIGRGTRLKTQEFGEKYGHQKCFILDFVDNSGKHSLVNSWELEKGKPIEDRMFLPAAHKEALIEQREKRIRTIEAQYGKDKKINLLELPEVRVWDSKKMREPATEKQLDWIKRMGVWMPDIEYTKSMASELISSQPAQGWQLQYLAQNGYDISIGATLGQFQRVKQSLERKNKFQIR
jgi:superfamily II DNA or RNA helicase